MNNQKQLELKIILDHHLIYDKERQVFFVPISSYHHSLVPALVKLIGEKKLDGKSTI